MLPSSEAEMRGAVEGLDGGPRARRRSPMGPRGVRIGRILGFFESSPFSQVGRRSWAFVGPVALTCALRFYGDLNTPIRVSLIVVPDTLFDHR